MPKTIKFVDTTKDLCESCNHAFKGGCPVWPCVNITNYCAQYSKRGAPPHGK